MMVAYKCVIGFVYRVVYRWVGVICTNSLNMVLLCFYIKEWIRGWVMRMPKTQDKTPRRKSGTFYKVDKQIR